ncbi:MAG: SDR family oxidoreductase [candidate division WOR-3 bacterium]|nr:SDR family oxidoreductase [candidate division WOR-3 bacterium]MCX7836707.1 SDR family oxidoreductase [candidate division WOR-3 bacterium]MDW8113456.1 SDR family oxidoreductase [candidate division WOR-3 bacterium]
MEKNKTLIITGGAGFIGSYLCEYFVKEGYKVICIDNLITGKKENIAHLLKESNFTFIKEDINEIDKNLLRDKDILAIFHFASPASPKDYFAYPLLTLKTNAFATYNLLELAKERKIIFFLASTSEVYGDPQVSPQYEEYWGYVNPCGLRSVYDEGKRFAESLTMAYYRQYGVSVRIARIFNTYGPRMRVDDGRVIPNFINQALKGKDITIYGDGNQTRSFCYIDDLLDGLIKLFYSDYCQPINLGNPEEIKVIDLAKKIISLTNSNSQIVYLPPYPDDPHRRCPDIKKAKEILNWEPKVSLEEGLKKTIDYFKSF